MSDKEMIYRLTKLLLEQEERLNREIADRDAVIDKLSDENGSLMMELKGNRPNACDLALAEKESVIKELSTLVEKLNSDIKEREEEIHNLSEQIDAKDEQISYLEQKVSEAILGVPFDGGKEEGKGKKHSLAVFLQCPDNKQRSFDSISSACKFISQELNGLHSADTIKSAFVKQRQKGEPQVFKGYTLIR